MCREGTAPLSNDRPWCVRRPCREPSLAPRLYSELTLLRAEAAPIQRQQDRGITV